jgi:hypothetical protein
LLAPDKGGSHAADAILVEELSEAARPARTFVTDTGLYGLIIPSAEAELPPLWRTPEEQAQVEATVRLLEQKCEELGD